jgi:hypothetical protein
MGRTPAFNRSTRLSYSTVFFLTERAEVKEAFNIPLTNIPPTRMVIKTILLDILVGVIEKLLINVKPDNAKDRQLLSLNQVF